MPLDAIIGKGRKRIESGGRKVQEMARKAARSGALPDQIPVFHQLLDRNMTEGVHAKGTPGVTGPKWTTKTLAEAVGAAERTVRNWRKGKNCPDELDSLERVFYGSDPAWDPDRKRFRAAFEVAVNRLKVDFDWQDIVVRPYRCFGREAEIAALSRSIAGPDAVAVLGPPGVGKTTLVREAASSPEVIERFGQRRWFVDLEAATDAGAVQIAITAAMGLNPGAVLFADALNRLSGDASLLVLDDLNTPWERDMKAVQDCLGQLSVLPNVKVVASLRGGMAPTAPVFGRPIIVEPLSLIEAKKLFLALAPGISPDDPHLDPLLHEFHGMPLAVELVAYHAAPFKTLQSVWDAWQRLGLKLATHPDQAVGRYTSVWQSIELSWQSPRLKQAGRRLFCMLAHVPGGMRRVDVTALMADDAYEAVRQLLATGLAFERGADRINLLPPIRAFAATLPPLAPEEAARLRDHFIRYGQAIMSRIETSGSMGLLKEEAENIEQAMQAAAEVRKRQIARIVAAVPQASQHIKLFLKIQNSRTKLRFAIIELAKDKARDCDTLARSARERSDHLMAQEAKRRANALQRLALLLQRDILSEVLLFLSI